MAGLHEGGNEPPGSLKAICRPHKSLMLAGNEFQSLGTAIVKEDEYEEVRWDGIVSIVSWRERVFRLWWEESTENPAFDWVGKEKPQPVRQVARVSFVNPIMTGGHPASAPKALVFLNRRMQRAGCEACLAQIRTKRDIVTGFYDCGVRGLRNSQP
ncbi:hypothetical protein ANN_19578 [Periplaneta americana]|uniref:Uncharacterized protein n=1 Tax=Periplaneta americana TaxID=6978 RepID=A0ABQ8SAX1_PERAM|nr:hypothetical protein ANN_19578 [Periplaneta americana]